MHNTIVLKKSDLGPMNVASSTGQATTKRTHANHEKWVLLIVVGMVLAAWQIGKLFDYKSGSGIGYSMGLVGGLMILLLFTYPLRKRIRALHNWGSTKFWFTLHMSLGVLGPVLVLAHTRFHLGSINATVAFTCMSLVAASGIIGRFMYIKIHKGLYGRRSSLNEMRELSGLASAEAESKLHFAPNAEKRMTEFEARALKKPSNPLSSIVKFLVLPIRTRLTYYRCSKELARLFKQHAAQKGWSNEKLMRRLNAARSVVFAYLKGAQDVAQFTAYERLFSLWHVLHVPLVYMLVLSAIAHVIAVHIY
jgi:hypothetical protein